LKRLYEKEEKAKYKKREGERAKKKMNRKETVNYHWHFDVGKKNQKLYHSVLSN